MDEVYPSLLFKFIDERKQSKMKRFKELALERKELFYDPLPDRLYADLNMNLTDKHLAMKMLEYLNSRIAEKAREIMRDEGRSKRSRVSAVAQLVKDIREIELIEASRKAAENVNIAEYIRKDLEALKPTSLIIFTDSPAQTAYQFKELKLDLAYNNSGNTMPIRIYATELEQIGGILTGRIKYIPDEIERFSIISQEHLAFLQDNIHSIY